MKTVIFFSVIVLFSSVSLAQEIGTVMKPDTISKIDGITPPPEVISCYDHPLPKIETVVDTAASFPGGRKELLKFLGKNIELPYNDTRNCYFTLSAKSIIKFVVGADSTISNVTVIRGAKDCKECDDEAIRVIKMMPCWIPAKKNGVDVNSYFTLPIEICLE